MKSRNKTRRPEYGPSPLAHAVGLCSELEDLKAQQSLHLRRSSWLRAAAVPSEFRLCAEAEPLELTAAEGEGENKKLPTFSGVAYNGGRMRPRGFYRDVVVDLSGVLVLSGSRPTLKDHDSAQIIGHSSSIDLTSKKIKVAGVISGTGQSAREVVETSANGFPWRLSIGARVDKMVFVDDGEKVQVNGRTFTGPLYVARNITLGEISFVALGADDKTSAKVAASAAQQIEVITMTFEQWLEARGFDPAEISDEQRTSLQAIYDAEQAAPNKQAGDAPGDGEDGKVNASADAGNPPAAGDPPDPLAEFRAEQAAETRRIAHVREVCAGGHAELEAKAIEEDWSKERIELEVLRASRSTGPAIHAAGGGRPANATVLEAGIRLGSQESEATLEAEYGAKTLEQGYAFRRMGIKDLIAACCQLDGVQHPGISANQSELLAAGFSTVSLPGILANTANKSMLAAYRAVPSAAVLIAKKLSVTDFKTHTGYRLTGNFTMEEVGPAGELKHGAVSEAAFPYSVKTYGKIFGLTRQMLINDDLGAFLEIPRMIGRGGALLREDIFWTLVLANTGSFFSNGNGNYISGATSALAAVGLGLAVVKLSKQTDPAGHPIVVTGEYLVVPPELQVTADELYMSLAWNTGGSSTTEKVPNRNIYAGKYKPTGSPYLSNSNYTGYSAEAWYLFGNPADVAAFGIAYLNGSENPVVEDAPLAGDVLGKAWRGYIDIGVCQIDKRGAVKSKGKA